MRRGGRLGSLLLHRCFVRRPLPAPKLQRLREHAVGVAAVGGDHAVEDGAAQQLVAVLPAALPLVQHAGIAQGDKQTAQQLRLQADALERLRNERGRVRSNSAFRNVVPRVKPNLPE